MSLSILAILIHYNRAVFEAIEGGTGLEVQMSAPKQTLDAQSGKLSPAA